MAPYPMKTNAIPDSTEARRGAPLLPGVLDSVPADWPGVRRRVTFPSTSISHVAYVATVPAPNRNVAGDPNTVIENSCVVTRGGGANTSFPSALTVTLPSIPVETSTSRGVPAMGTLPVKVLTLDSSSIQVAHRGSRYH